MIRVQIADRRDALIGIGAIGLLAYYVMAGDPAWRETFPVAKGFGAAAAGAVVAYYAFRASGRMDRLDRALLLGVLLFAIIGIFSVFPRQSFDSCLAVLAYAAGVYLARDVLADEKTRRLFVVALMALSSVITLLIAVPWLTLYLRWWSITDWTLVPPLGMDLPSSPWGHRHDAALLVTMLYPAWWIGKMGRARMVGAFAVGFLVLAVVVIGGSRMVWLGVAVATLTVAAPIVIRRARLSNWALTLIAVAALVAAVGILVLGAAAPLLERMLGGASLAERTAMWGPLVDAWAEKPLTGWGPGSFPWVLQQTAYFDAQSFSPRHPDSAPVQLLGEGGVIGLLAMAIVVAALLPAIRRGRSVHASWALTVFALAALAGNPTDFEFMVAMGIGWLAYAVPHQPEPIRQGESPRLARLATSASLLVIGVAFAATIAGDIAYASARSAAEEDRLGDAVGALGIAKTLDPSLAIYPRQLGTLRLIQGDAGNAIRDLQVATELNPSDDLAWRTLALALELNGKPAAARAAASRALELQRSDISNLLVATDLAEQAEPERTALLEEIVQGWPEIVAAPEWGAFANGIPTDAVAQASAARWERGIRSPEPLRAQRLLLGVLTGSNASPLPRSPLSNELAAAYVAVMGCDPAAEAQLENTSASDKRSATYWMLAYRLAVLRGDPGVIEATALAIIEGEAPIVDSPFQPLNPLDENGVRGSSADRWGYRRTPILWPHSQWAYPSPRTGLARILAHPTAIAACQT